MLSLGVLVSSPELSYPASDSTLPAYLMIFFDFFFGGGIYFGEGEGVLEKVLSSIWCAECILK